MPFPEFNINASIYEYSYFIYQITYEYSSYVVLLFYVHGKHLRSCRDGQLT